MGNCYFFDYFKAPDNPRAELREVCQAERSFVGLRRVLSC
jgi:hypothetical protein